MKSEFKGNIISVRAVEDSIRSTRKYTKGAFNRSPELVSIQGGNFPSKTVTEYYEVYPELEISWNMLATDAWALIWGDVTHIDIRFQYDYRINKAKMVIYGGAAVIKELSRGIPGFSSALDEILRLEREQERQESNGHIAGDGNGHSTRENGSGALADEAIPGQMVDNSNRVRTGLIPRP